jgi:hypothetical protein
LIFSGTQFLAPGFANAGEPEQLLLVSTLGCIGKPAKRTAGSRDFDGAARLADRTGRSKPLSS